MDALKSFNIKKSILLLKKLKDGNLVIVDAQNSIRIIDTETYGVVGGFKTSLHHDRMFGTHVDVSNDGNYTISIIPGSSKAALFSIARKSILYKIGRHKGPIESVAIDPESRYCATGGQDGKVFLWVLKSARLAHALPPHADYVTTIAFDPKGQWIATGSYDRSINVVSMSTMKRQYKLSGHKSAIIKIIFLPGGKLLSVDKEAMMILWDLRNGKLIKRLTKMSDEVSTMCASLDGRFVFVGTKLGYIGLYDMQTHEQLKHRYIKENETVSSMILIDDPLRLAIGTVEGNVRIFSLFGDEEALMQMLRKQEFKLFYEQVSINPMLSYSRPYQMANLIWEETLKNARFVLEKGEREKAKTLLSPFSGIPSKNGLISQIFSSYDKYDQFKNNVMEGRYQLAYALAKQYPAFQESELYIGMETRWKKLFAKAQELILQPGGDEKARDLLTPYRGISEKTALIKQMFEESQMYVYMKKLIAQRDFVKFFELVKLHPFLKEFNEYDTVSAYGDKLYIQSQKAFTEGDQASARKMCEILMDFPDYAAEAEEMSESIRVKHLFYDAIASNNLVNAFAYLAAYPLLYDTKEAQMLETQWKAVVDKAQRFAAKGMVKETYEVFEPYRTIREKYVIMGGVVAQAYSALIEQKLRNRMPQVVLESDIRHYIETFGIDEAILLIYEHFKKLYTSTLDPDMLKQGDIDMWTPSTRIVEISEL